MPVSGISSGHDQGSETITPDIRGLGDFGLSVAGACNTEAMAASPDWFEMTQRNARSVQTPIGWIFWDPGATARYVNLGLPEDFAEPLGYIAALCAPLAAAGPDAVIAAFGSISSFGIRAAFDLLDHDPVRFEECRRARDEAVVEGLQAYAPDIVDPLVELGPELWPVVEQLPLVGRVFMAADLALPRPDDPLLSGWHAVNCIREWRGDTHWALVVAAGLTPPCRGICWGRNGPAGSPRRSNRRVRHFSHGSTRRPARTTSRHRVSGPDALR